MSANPISEVPAHLCGRSLRGVMHACAFVDSRNEQYRILLPYLEEGLRSNAQLVTMVGQANVRDHLERLRRAGMDPEPLCAGGKLSVTTSEESFPRSGTSTPTSILKEWELRIDHAQRAGFSAVRSFGEMDDALAALRRTDELLEYEARVNFLALNMTSPMVCIYDVSNISASLVIDILKTHPKVILDGALQENPYFVSPEQFLRQLVERKRRRMRVRERRAFALRI